MTDFPSLHRHLDEDQVDELARAVLDGSGGALKDIQCEECEERVSEHGRCLSLARLLTRDTLPPHGRPAVDAVRIIRRSSYRRRVLGEVTGMLLTSPMKASAGR